MHRSARLRGRRFRHQTYAVAGGHALSAVYSGDANDTASTGIRHTGGAVDALPNRVDALPTGTDPPPFTLVRMPGHPFGVSAVGTLPSTVLDSARVPPVEILGTVPSLSFGSPLTVWLLSR